MIGKVIKVISTRTVYNAFIGRYGVITKRCYGDKWFVEFCGSTEKMEGFSLSVSEKDFKVVGEIYK